MPCRPALRPERRARHPVRHRCGARATPAAPQGAVRRTGNTTGASPARLSAMNRATSFWGYFYFSDHAEGRAHA
jgi:hypothetical protein